MVDSLIAVAPADVGRLLRQRLEEAAPGRIQLVTGPRQVGKTTLLLELAGELGDAGFYVAADAPEAGVPGYWERFWSDLESRAGHRKTVALLDEVHLMPDWAASLKARWDRFRRHKLPVHLVATGSSALRVTAGSRESLAGRFERIVFSHWGASAVAEAFGLPIDEAVLACVRYGTYPGAWAFTGDLARWRAYLREAIIEPAIGRDVLALGQVRRPGLLRQVFAAAVASPAQVLSLQKLQGQLQDRGALETVAHYLELLRDAYLVAPLEKYMSRGLRQRAAPPKLVTLNNALLSAMHPDGPPDPDRDAARFGAWVENACVASAVNQGQRVTYWREEPVEVDAVIEGNWGSWVIEVKTGRLDSRDVQGVLEFSRRHPKVRPLLVTRPGGEAMARRFGVDAVSWIDFLSAGPGGTRG